jgi:PEGA domain
MVVLLLSAFAALLVIASGGGAEDGSPAEITIPPPVEPAHGIDPTGVTPAGPAPDPGNVPAANNPTVVPSPIVPPPVAPVQDVVPASVTPESGALAPPIEPPVENSKGEQTVSTTMHLQVTSDPKGADVYLGGKRLGVTPLSVYLPKRNGSASLTVRRQRFVEGNAKIDLSAGEVTKAFSLRRTAPERVRDHGDDEPGDAKPACQRPESANPFDETPICARP